MTRIGCWVLAWVLVVPAIGSGEPLPVGPGKKFVLPSKAIAAARDGDVIEIDSAGRYDGDVATIRAANLTIRGVGSGRPRIDAKGNHAGGKGIWVQYAENLTVENIE